MSNNTKETLDKLIEARRKLDELKVISEVEEALLLSDECAKLMEELMQTGKTQYVPYPVYPTYTWPHWYNPVAPNYPMQTWISVRSDSTYQSIIPSGCAANPIGTMISFDATSGVGNQREPLVSSTIH